MPSITSAGGGKVRVVSGRASRGHARGIRRRPVGTLIPMFADVSRGATRRCPRGADSAAPLRTSLPVFASTRWGPPWCAALANQPHRKRRAVTPSRGPRLVWGNVQQLLAIAKANDG